MNLLIPSIGSKAYLARRLRAAVNRRGGRLIVADLDRAAAGVTQADAWVPLPAFGERDYWDALRTVLDRHAIGAVIPVRDAELLGWSERAAQLPARVLISPPPTLRICRDKVRLYRTAATLGVHSPAWIPFTRDASAADRLGFPLVAKPASGAGSRGVSVLHGQTELDVLAVPDDTPVLLQRHVAGHEYSVDGYADEAGRLISCLVRKRLVVRDGECVSGQVVEDARLVELCMGLAQGMQFRGVFNVQFIRGPHGDLLIDLNPRFPGGIALTEAAGRPYTEWAVGELFGEALHTSLGST